MLHDNAHGLNCIILFQFLRHNYDNKEHQLHDWCSFFFTVLINKTDNGIIFLTKFRGNYLMNLFYILLFVTIIILAIIVLPLLSIIRNKREIIASGKQGEESTAYLLYSLPDDYKLIRNAVISYEGKESEIDNIVVGATGVFVIETKNHKGHIFGDCDERYWLQYKIDKYGISHTKNFYNPTKQVATHIYRLKGILKENKIRVYINGAVYFSNPENEVNIENPREDIPVFNYYSQYELLNYILCRDKILNDKQVEQIVNIINEKQL